MYTLYPVSAKSARKEIYVKQGKQGVYARYIKRLLDILLSGCALIVLSPVLLIVAILVRVKLGSPVIFCQERPGKHGKIFKLYKFRSMTDARNEDGALLPDERLHRGRRGRCRRGYFPARIVPAERQ